MKKMFTKLFGNAVLIGLLMTGATVTVKAQTTFASDEPLHKDAVTTATKTDSAATLTSDEKTLTASTTKKTDDDADFKPVRRLWGYTFGDFYYAAQAPSLTATPAITQGKETNYYGVPPGRNAFQIRRVYLGYDYDITKNFSAELLLEAAPNAINSTATGTSIINSDNLADNKMAFYIKLINLRWKNIWNGTDFVIGQVSTPGFATLTEKIWGYRSIEKTVADFHKTNSYDMGATFQGVFDPGTKNFGYDIMLGDNTGANNATAAANSGFFKALYGDLWAKALNQTLVFQIYGDYMQTSSTIPATGLPPQSHSMVKGFVAYTTPKFTVGVEAFTNTFKNGLTVKGTTTNENASAQAISIYAHGAISSKVSLFARYDGYNPDANSNYDPAAVYTVNTNFSSYDPYTKETFTTAGIDFSPAKNVHFMPNLWYVGFKDRRDVSTTGYEGDNHLLVYRLTFYCVFGK